MQLINFAIYLEKLLSSLIYEYHISYKEFWNYFNFNVDLHWYRCMENFWCQNRNERNSFADVENQGAETEEIAYNVEPVTTRTNDIATNIVLITQDASEIGTAGSQAVSSLSELLVKPMPSTSEVSKF
jgi:hypothetical protein